MCDFCHKHGEGKKWYLQAKNYSEDLLSDLRRRQFIKDFFPDPPGRVQRSAQESARRRERLKLLPAFVRRALDLRLLDRQKRTHYGQVLPIEDVEQVFGFVNSITRLACFCRQATVGNEQRYCYGVSMASDGGELGRIIREIGVDYLTGPNTVGLESLTKEEALASFREHEREGLCHSVWTFITPFIGGICNCDRSDCLAMRSTVTRGWPVMFRAEYVSEVNPDLCNGCRVCMRVCQFGAISYSAAHEKVVIDPRWCYGCGVCRAVCTKDAITLRDRSSVPVAATLW